MKIEDVSAVPEVLKITRDFPAQESFRQKNLTSPEKKRATLQKEPSLQEESFEEGLKLKQLNKTLKKINLLLGIYEKKIGFRLHREIGTLQVLVYNKEDNEIIKKIPPEEILEMEKRLKEMVGVFLDKYL
ncbi:MAG: hypothetical protein STSR0004_07530 [Peptococcaceae bacterium]